MQGPALSRCNDPACSTCICYVIKTPIGRPNRATCDLTPAVPRHHLMYARSPPWPLHPAIASALRILRTQFDGLPVCRVNLEMAGLGCLGATKRSPNSRSRGPLLTRIIQIKDRPNLKSPLRTSPELNLGNNIQNQGATRGKRWEKPSRTAPRRKLPAGTARGSAKEPNFPWEPWHSAQDVLDACSRAARRAGGREVSVPGFPCQQELR